MKTQLLLACLLLAGCQSEPPPQRVIIEFEGEQSIRDKIETASPETDQDPRAQYIDKMTRLEMKRTRGVATEAELEELKPWDIERAKVRAENNLRLGRPPKDEAEAALMKQIESEAKHGKQDGQ